MTKLSLCVAVALSVATVQIACSSKNSNNDINDAETVSGRSAPASWAKAEAKWTRIDPWDGSCPEVKFTSDSDGNFHSEGCGGEVLGRLTAFEINRLNDAANAVVPVLGEVETCDLQKTPDLKLEEILTTPDENPNKFMYTTKDGRTCRRGDFVPVTTLARVLLEIQLKYEPGLPRPIPTPTPEPTPTPPPIPLPSEPIPIPPATPKPTAPPIPSPF